MIWLFQVYLDILDIDAHQGDQAQGGSVFFTRKYPPAGWKWYALNFLMVPAVMGGFRKISKNQGGIIMAFKQSLGIKIKSLFRAVG